MIVISPGAVWHSTSSQHRLRLTPKIELRVEKRRGDEPGDPPQWVVICETLGVDRDIQAPGDVKKQALEQLIVQLEGFVYELQQRVKDGS